MALISSLSFLISYQQENKQMTEELWDGDTQMTPAPGQAWGLGARLPRCQPPAVPYHPLQPSCSLTPRGHPVLGGQARRPPWATGPRCQVQRAQQDSRARAALGAHQLVLLLHLGLPLLTPLVPLPQLGQHGLTLLTQSLLVFNELQSGRGR